MVNGMVGSNGDAVRVVVHDDFLSGLLAGGYLRGLPTDAEDIEGNGGTDQDRDNQPREEKSENSCGCDRESAG